MSVYREVELRCDGRPGDPYGCEPAIYAKTGHQARQEARAAGWLTGALGGKDYCSDHRPRLAAGAQP